MTCPEDKRRVCPCGRPTLSPPLCFYCASGTSEAAQAEIRDAKRLALSGDWSEPQPGVTRVWTVFSLLADASGLFCWPGLWNLTRGATIAVFRQGAGGRWARSEPCPEVNPATSGVSGGQG